MSIIDKGFVVNDKATGLDNKEFVNKLIISGSTAIQTKNSKNVHVFNDSSNKKGVISAKLVKPKYDTNEVKKSIDTNIVELIPVQPPDLQPTVLKTVFDAVVNELSELSTDILSLNETILQLQNKITSLEIENNSLKFEKDALQLLIAAEENQNQISVSKIQSTIIDLQNSIQRATNEAIQRVSLNARNEALKQEIDNLKRQLDDVKKQLERTINDFNLERQNLNNRLSQTQQQLSEQQKQTALQQSISNELSNGAFGNNNLTARPTPITDNTISAIAWRGRPSDNFNNTDTKWINGSSINIFNPTNNPLVVSFRQGVDFLQNLNSITIPAGQTATITLNPDLKKVNNFVKISDTLDTGELSIITPTTTIKIPMELQIQRGSDYTRRS
jgi:regulator of replication initiation timing